MERWEEIRDECRAAADATSYSDVNTKSLTTKGEWRKVPLWSYGRRYEEHLKQCPVTDEVLKKLPLCNALGSAYFSIVSGGSDIKPHFGPTNARLRYHLGLDVPKVDAYIAIADGMYRWAEGRVIAFDDSYIHAVRHSEGDARRILIVDVYHPELTREERQVLEELEGVHRQFFAAGGVGLEQLPH
eukprot:TRINITY_DN22615_c0_g1_i3.p1 TRINITY_DN22615_c0_g1~~TRINITY_DN22615_c0_g1_i3.p1  ORF type:complete len:186 (+),score=26.11 TRINITY_DN22615_c0_g1_i3:67-624(+)